MFIISDVPGCGIGSYTGDGIQHCGNDKAAIATVNYPELYQHKAYNEWHIETRDGTFIELIFQDFDIPASDASCSKDYVITVDNFVRESPRYCNINVPPSKPIRSSFNRLKVVFRAGSSELGKGFYAEYRAMTFEFQKTDSDTAVQSPGMMEVLMHVHISSNCQNLCNSQRFL